MSDNGRAFWFAVLAASGGWWVLSAAAVAVAALFGVSRAVIERVLGAGTLILMIVWLVWLMIGAAAWLWDRFRRAAVRALGKQETMMGDLKAFLAAGLGGLVGALLIESLITLIVAKSGDRREEVKWVIKGAILGMCSWTLMAAAVGLWILRRRATRMGNQPSQSR